MTVGNPDVFLHVSVSTFTTQMKIERESFLTVLTGSATSSVGRALVMFRVRVRRATKRVELNADGDILKEVFIRVNAACILRVRICQLALIGSQCHARLYSSFAPHSVACNLKGEIVSQLHSNFSSW